MWGRRAEGRASKIDASDADSFPLGPFRRIVFDRYVNQAGHEPSLSSPNASHPLPSSFRLRLLRLPLRS